MMAIQPQVASDSCSQKLIPRPNDDLGNKSMPKYPSKNSANKIQLLMHVSLEEKPYKENGGEILELKISAKKTVNKRQSGDNDDDVNICTDVIKEEKNM